MPEGHSDPQRTPRKFGNPLNQLLWTVCGFAMLATLALITQLATGLAEITAMGLVMPVLVGGLTAFTLRYFVYRSNRLLRAQARRELEAKDAQLRFVFDNMTSGILMVDENKVIRAINKNMVDLYGFPIAEVKVGQPFSNIIHFRAKRGDYGPGDIDHQIAERFKMWKPGGVENFEDIIPGGPVIEVLRAWTAEGDAVMVANDITDRKHAEEEIAAQRDELATLNQQKNKLFSIISHDLKNPFTSLLGMSKIMAQMSDKLTPEQFTDYAKSINESGERLFVLLQNLLEWSRSQMDQVSIDLQPQELRALVDDTLELLSNSAQDKGIQFVNSVPELTVNADLNLVSTVIRNLLSNAIKFTDETGSISIAASKNGDWVEISVTDSGVGMSAEQVGKVFKADSAQSTHGTKGESGTGLGLLLCKDFVERHGGNIWAESEIGKGSSFHFTLPLNKETAEQHRDEMI